MSDLTFNDKGVHNLVPEMMNILLQNPLMATCAHLSPLITTNSDLIKELLIWKEHDLLALCHYHARAQIAKVNTYTHILIFIYNISH